MKTNLLSHVSTLCDRELLARAQHDARRERHATAELMADLAEIDARGLYLGLGFGSLFAYCTSELRLSEAATYNRIEVIRAVRSFPVILEYLADGSLNVSTARVIAPHLTDDNHSEVLELARNKSKRDVEMLARALAPRPDVPDSIRRLPPARPPSSPPSELLEAVAHVVSARTDTVAPPTPPMAAPPAPPPQLPQRPAVVASLAPGRHKIEFTIDDETRENLELARDLLRHAVPDGSLHEVFRRALDLLIDHLLRVKFAATEKPRAASGPGSDSRYIPAEVKRAVYRRDRGRCVFVGAHGRCGSRGFVEFHHLVPYSAGGEATVSNIEIRCSRHNAYEWKQYCLSGGFEPGAGVLEEPGVYTAITIPNPSMEQLAPGQVRLQRCAVGSKYGEVSP